MTQEQQPLTKVVKLVKCEQCGWIWEPMVADPKVCARCKSYDWKVPKVGVDYQQKPTERALRETPGEPLPFDGKDK